MYIKQFRRILFFLLFLRSLTTTDFTGDLGVGWAGAIIVASVERPNGLDEDRWEHSLSLRGPDQVEHQARRAVADEHAVEVLLGGLETRVFLALSMQTSTHIF